MCFSWLPAEDKGQGTFPSQRHKRFEIKSSVRGVISESDAFHMILLATHGTALF